MVNLMLCVLFVCSFYHSKKKKKKKSLGIAKCPLVEVKFSVVMNAETIEFLNFSPTEISSQTILCCGVVLHVVDV